MPPRAQGIGINPIVMIVIAVLTMTSVALFYTGAFTGQGKELSGSTISGTKSTDVESSVKCNQFCLGYNTLNRAPFERPPNCECEDEEDAPVCGDDTCEGAKGESCPNCWQDCCPPACGDGTCDGSKGETCSNCWQDCCPPECGDGKCEPEKGECTTCAGPGEDCWGASPCE